MKALLKYALLYLFHLAVALWNVSNLADGVFTGIELLQTAMVFVFLYLAAYNWIQLKAAWTLYRRRRHVGSIDHTRTEPKCRILHIGTIETTADGTEQAVGWYMDCEHSYASFISVDSETGVQRFGGYTIAELKAIIAAEQS